MFTVATDVQKIIMEFIEPQEIKALYETCKKSKVMFDELTKHTNFIVSCKRIMLDQEIKWFELKNIKLQLVVSYRNHNGDQIWYKNGLCHRDNDLPAVILSDGHQIWYKNDVRHRDNDLPAEISISGTQKWYRNGLIHRDNDMPAILYKGGFAEWYKNDVRYKSTNRVIVKYKNDVRYKKTNY